MMTIIIVTACPGVNHPARRTSSTPHELPQRRQCEQNSMICDVCRDRPGIMDPWPGDAGGNPTKEIEGRDANAAHDLHEAVLLVGGKIYDRTLGELSRTPQLGRVW